MTRITLLTIGILLTGVAAQASQPGNGVIKNWKSADLCAKKAQQAYPDFTAEANAKRDVMLKLCLEGSNLPPRVPQQ
jgi:hypothetical protein